MFDDDDDMMIEECMRRIRLPSLGHYAYTRSI